MSFLPRVRDDAKPVDDIGVVVSRPSIDSLAHWAQSKIRNDYRKRADRRRSVPAISTKCSDRARTPQRRSGIQSHDVQTVAQNDAGTEKADSGHDLPRNL